MHVLTQLNHIGQRVAADIDNVNHGGCCVFAAAVARQLRDLNLADNVCLRVGAPYDGDYSAVNFDEVRNNVSSNTLREWSEQGVTFGHVIVEFAHDGIVYHYDTSGIHGADKEDPTFGFMLYADALTVEEAEALASVGNQWNRKFNRDNIPKIEKIVESLKTVDR